MNLRQSTSFNSASLLVCAIAAMTLSACASESNENKGQSVAGNANVGGNPRTGTGVPFGNGGSGATNATSGAAGTSSGCGETAMVATRRPVNVLVLLDRSQSMLSAISTTDSTTRWAALRNALNGAMSRVSDHVAFGLKLFPDGDATEAQQCSVLATAPEVALGLGSPTVSAIDLTIAQAVPNGGTPIAQALSWASTYFTTGPGSQSVGDRVVLLATDGAPNCNASATCELASCVTNIDHPEATTNLCTAYPTECLDGANARAKVEALLTQAVPVRAVVVGIPGSDKPAYAAVLDTLGKAGGLPNPDPVLDYFAVSAEQGAVGLSETLLQITSQLIVTCKLELTSVPPDPQLLNVYVDGVKVPKDATDGWKLDSTSSPPTVVLQGTACSKLETSGAQSISIKYGCPTYVLL